jgi:hypothetical protein
MGQKSVTTSVVPFWYGSGSADLWIRTTDSDPAFFAEKMPTKNKVFFELFYLSIFGDTVHLHQSSKIKSKKEAKK